MGSPVVHFEIGGVDAARSRSFYESMFGWSVRTDDDGYGMVSTGSGEGIAGGITAAPPGVPPWVTFYVRVEDVEESLVRAEELGGRRIMGPTAVGGAGRMGMFTDPDGNAIGLFAEV
ncbi:VOC family protein [Pseudonocardia sp. KRD-184]|uniref:VOC family protein n=1 Tax=Pseudonocardia oceani TaxID=2792013 RepID=A0ABS6UHG9_9PSEU|nr:VOC family protein [Pseudonocardia oceani]MBW0092819.1 VOC family protein [Pseudonocardia oceani]MBW0096033.1 VOC family protein [Pseudonocardia oceani]MBW0111840.1 VOC family protein [Pseudonocardia oceani]MBW0122942.1 VOC family protein [Pseudonocardia oceani]MBW0131695.1 VOC family protein [Pseudonocardia oceani]